MPELDDNRPFPIQGELRSVNWRERSACTIPWWLARVAYTRYVSLYGQGQSLERLAERGGFGRQELLDLLKSL